MKRVFKFKGTFLLLAFLIVLSATFYGCDGIQDAESAESKDMSKQTEVLVPHLGEADYSGRTLKILATNYKNEYGDIQIATSELNTEPVNDAIYNRNEMLFEEYGFRIEPIYTEGFEEFLDKVRNETEAGLNEYDVITTGVFTLSKFVTEGKLYDLYNLEGSHLQLEEEWWDTMINEDITIGHKLFFTTGDIFILDDERTVVTYFNKDLIEKNALDNPYDLVKEGTWTIDVMYEMIKTVAVEDGDGVMNVTGDDIWGLVGQAYDFYKYIVSCNNPQTYKYEDTDLPYLAMTEPRAIRTFQKVFDMYTDKDRVAYTEQYYAWDDTDASTVVDNFYNGKALFFASTISAVNSPKMKEAEGLNYGILPEPKLNEDQEKYTSVVDPYHFYCLSILNNAKDIDFTTFALEAMAYTSWKYVTPEYYDRTLQLKRFDDQESPEMLDIIFSNRLADLSIIFNWNDCIQYYNNLLFANSDDIVSFVDARREAFEIEMNATIEAIQQIE